MENQALVSFISDYSEILQAHRLEFIPSSYYWQVGKITRTQGWILHLSAINSQVWELLETVIPLLKNNNAAFKIVRDQLALSHLLDGGLGYIHLGKIVSIYPETDEKANNLAQLLIQFTNRFSGPTIPTDRHLGGVVYTRYGSFNPVLVDNQKNEPVPHIYDHKGQLIVDPYAIPFVLPEGINWPFSDIVEPMHPPRRKLLNYSYYPIVTIKPDAKGDVIKGIYFKKIWQIRSCLIKQGRHHMFTDAAGRDIRDRLAWQYELYQALHTEIPMPEVFDLFTEYGDTYLAMAYIKGQLLRTWIDSIYQGNSWLNLTLSCRLQLIDRLLEILSIVGQMHQKGYLHRDITSMNFLIDRKGQIWLIDLELAWCINNKIPDPPFAQGTCGFMSPEQYAFNARPTVKEDIYGLGALATEFLTNLYPFKLDQRFTYNLQEALLYFTGDSEIAKCISLCQSQESCERPSLDELRNAVEKYRTKLLKTNNSDIPHTSHSLSSEQLDKIIQAGLTGLSHPDVAIPQLGWCSMRQRNEGHIGNQQMEISVYEGWHSGMAGPLWMVAKSKKNGFDIEKCIEIYHHSWKYIHAHCFEDVSWSNYGLYTGMAGIALALVEGLTSELLKPTAENLRRLEVCFAQQTDRLNLSHGIAGQGIALLRATEWMDSSLHAQLLSSYVQLIMDHQLPDGSWNTGPSPAKRRDTIIGLGKGVAGISWFLLAYLEKYPSDAVRISVEKALKWLLHHAKRRGNSYTWAMSTEFIGEDNSSLGYGTLGVLLLFIKAYPILKEPLCRDVAQNSLLSLPAQPIYMDFSQDSGLATLGELYLEAAAILEDPVWKERADWIAGVFAHCMKKREHEGGFWLTSTSEFPTADLFTDNSGILHFLIRNYTNKKNSHPLWPS